MSIFPPGIMACTELNQLTFQIAFVLMAVLCGFLIGRNRYLRRVYKLQEAVIAVQDKLVARAHQTFDEIAYLPPASTKEGRKALCAELRVGITNVMSDDYPEWSKKLLNIIDELESK